MNQSNVPRLDVERSSAGCTALADHVARDARPGEDSTPPDKALPGSAAKIRGPEDGQPRDQRGPATPIARANSGARERKSCAILDSGDVAVVVIMFARVSRAACLDAPETATSAKAWQQDVVQRRTYPSAAPRRSACRWIK